FDTAKVPEGSLESGSMAILQADDIASMAAGTATAVPTAQIISVDYTNGKVLFWVDHLSIFGIGGALGGGGGIIGDDQDLCFIATAAYGSLFEPHVQILREFRDAYLLTNSLGSGFVDLYYRYSPPMADFIAGHDGLRLAVRWGLSPFVGVSYLMLHTTPAQKTLIFIMLLGFGIALYQLRRRSLIANNE
ncbi:MAG: hypothetical protein JW882_12265, partial [Deltaproteobacteria bacterium]|nr:hypothetical protein [Deltaproteobacteria bacterium]